MRRDRHSLPPRLYPLLFPRPMGVGRRTCLQRQAPLASAATGYGWILNAYDDWVFRPETALFTVREHCKVASLDGFGLRDRLAAIGAAGAVLHYLTQHLRRDAANLTRISFYQRSDYLALDFTTLRHLEILEPLHHDAPRTASFYGALNRTVTPMGARRLRNWLSQPLATVDPIRRRQEAVQVFLDNPDSLEGLRSQLAQVRDLERTIGRLSAGTGNARDLLALRMALGQLPGLKKTIQDVAGAKANAESVMSSAESEQGLLTSALSGGADEDRRLRRTSQKMKCLSRTSLCCSMNWPPRSPKCRTGGVDFAGDCRGAALGAEGGRPGSRRVRFGAG